MLSAAALLTVTQLDASGVAYTPALMWGPEGLGFGRGAKHLDAVSGQDLEVAVAALLGQPGNEGAPLLASEPARGARLPEVQLVFLLEGLGTEDVRLEGGQLRHVQSLMDSAPASLTAPFTTRSSRRPSIFEKAPRLRPDEVEAHLRAHPEILTNGAADLLLVEHAAADLSAHDEAVHRVCGHVAGATSGNYGALVTGSKLPLEAPRRRLSSGETGVKLMIERDLLTGLLVFALLFTIFISGFCCLFSLQTPRKFEDGSKAQ